MGSPFKGAVHHGKQEREATGHIVSTEAQGEECWCSTQILLSSRESYHLPLSVKVGLSTLIKQI